MNTKKDTPEDMLAIEDGSREEAANLLGTDDDADIANLLDSEEDEVVEIDLALESRPLRIKLPSGDYVRGELRAVSGEDRDTYFTEVNKRMRYNAAGNPIGLSSMRGIQVLLLKHAVYNEHGQLFKDTTISKWPSLVQNTLFKLCKKMSHISDEVGEGDEGED